MKSERSKPLSKLSKEERKLKRGSVSFKKILKKINKTMRGQEIEAKLKV